jgi:hypothetical protein
MTGGDEYWASTSGSYASPGWAGVRVGEVIVSVSVRDRAGRTASVEAARDLANLVAARVTSTGLAATGG